jgi:hypothetical protein
MDATVELAIVDGSIALDAFGFVVLAGTFDLVKQTNVAIDDGKPVVQCRCAEPVGDGQRLCRDRRRVELPNSSTATVVRRTRERSASAFRARR